MCKRQEMVPHISKAELEFNEVWMSISKVAVIRSRKSSQEIPANNIWVEVRWEANQIDYTWDHIDIGKVWHGLENMDKILPQYFTLCCSLFHCFVVHKAFSASQTTAFGIHSSDGCESCFSAMSTVNSIYLRVSCIHLEIEFSALARNACAVFTLSFCSRSVKVADTCCMACGTCWGLGSAF